VDVFQDSFLNQGLELRVFEMREKISCGANAANL
jgi:hypothetical protein